MKNFVMIGAPVTFVRTPDLLKEYFKNWGIEVEIETKHVESSDLENFMNSMEKNSAIDGLLVTMPHKKTVLKHLKEINKVAYLRFASVYKEFSDASDFEKEVAEL